MPSAIFLRSTARPHPVALSDCEVCTESKMEICTQTPSCFSKGFLFSVFILALWLPQSSQAVLHIKKIPEQPQKNQDLLLSLHGVPSNIQDFMWYLGEETNGGTRLFSYILGLPRPQRDGDAMGQRDIVGFPNGSMLLRNAQPSDSGTYQVAVTINPAWIMKAKTEVLVANTREYSMAPRLPVSAGIMAATIIGSLAVGALLVGGIVYFLVTRRQKGKSPRCLSHVGIPATEQPELNTSPESGQALAANSTAVLPDVQAAPSPWGLQVLGKHYQNTAGDSNIYEVMPSPVFLVSPISDTEAVNPAIQLSPQHLGSKNLSSFPSHQQQPGSQHYQELLNPDPAPYCQLVPTS
ncbi:carcinoembryonic antigen-related cell adhesion molecule 19 [Sigmodon hispidus]